MNLLNWRCKAILKVFFSFIPNAKRFLTHLGFYRAGSKSDKQSNAPVTSFFHHLENIKASKNTPLSILDFGSGPTNYASLATLKYKITHFTQIDIEQPRYSLASLVDSSHSLPYSANEIKSAISFLNSQRYSFHTASMKTMLKIQSHTYNLIYSHSVLQHIYYDQILFYLDELVRLTSPNGYQSHYIDFRDFLSDSFNIAKFPFTQWESSLIRKAGFYSNRLRPSFYLNYFRHRGLHVNIIKTKYFPRPLPSDYLLKYPNIFREPNDLRIAGLTFTVSNF